MDQPGIVARLTSVLRNLGVNIEELSATQESAPFAGSPLFQTEMTLTVPPTVPLGKLRAELDRYLTETKDPRAVGRGAEFDHYYYVSGGAALKPVEKTR